MKEPDRQKELQHLAWIGDAVLALWARQWLLQRDGRMDSESFVRMTSNRFLACIGNPTAVEAAYGELYLKLGLEKAFAKIESELVPIFERQEKNRRRR